LELPLSATPKFQHKHEHIIESNKTDQIAHTQQQQVLLVNTNHSELPGVKVLLVEDGVDNQRLISYLLRKAGCEVELAVNGKLGVEAVLANLKQERQYDVILMDMSMPVMDGYTAAATLRQQNYAGPIIALTAHAMKSDRDKCLAAGCTDFTTKPINKSELLMMVKKYQKHEIHQTEQIVI
jgi:CheY-like chemotaxis protein